MPVMNGFEATRRIKEMIKANQIKEMKIIGTTADSIGDKLRNRCSKSGFDDLICKPVKK